MTKNSTPKIIELDINDNPLEKKGERRSSST